MVPAQLARLCHVIITGHVIPAQLARLCHVIITGHVIPAQVSRLGHVIRSRDSCSSSEVTMIGSFLVT